MDHLPDQSSESKPDILLDSSPSPAMPPAGTWNVHASPFPPDAYVPRPPGAGSPPAQVASPRRRISFMLFILIFLIGLMLIPWLAEQIVYSLKRGEERAKAEVARALLAELPSPDQRIPWVAKAVAPSVVGIQTISPARRGALGMDVGSGVIVDVEGNVGYILTNHHVIAKAQFVRIRLNDGRVLEDIEVVGWDEATDLAVLRVRDTHLEAIAWGDSSRIEVGDQVVAIGNPYDLGQTVTSGIISATERFNPIPSRNRVQEFLQTDAAINPGNSGGPLVDLDGKLIGINTMIFSETGGNLGIGFAIPSLLVKRVYEEIRKHGKMQHGWLGIYMDRVTPQQAAALGQEVPKGVVVADFFPQSPARDAGVQKRDILLYWGDTEIRDPLHLSHLIVLSQPGSTESVRLVRKGETIRLDIVLGSRPVDLQ